MTDTIKQLKCLRCGKAWFPKKPNSKPKHCAKCNTPYWNTIKGSVPRGRRKQN